MDLDSVKQEVVTREFLAIVLAGPGDGLVPLTGDYGDEPCPKALLPVGNRPLIEYVLSWLEQSGIKDVLLVCPTRQHSSLYHHIYSNISPTLLKIDLQTFDGNEDGNDGTCALLRHFIPRISEDFIIVPCDFIPPPSLPLSILLDKFRVETLSENFLAMTCWYAVRPPEKGSLIEEWGTPSSASAMIWDPRTKALLHIDTPDDRDRNPGDIELRMSMLKTFPRTNLLSLMEDSHVYVCRRLVLELLKENADFSSVRQDFFPWLCKNQYLQSTSSKIGAFIHDGPEFPMRINSLQNFYEMNRRILAGTTFTLPTEPKDRSLIDQKAQISTDCIVGNSTQINERSTIKKSVIGRHCVVGKMVKISSCVLLDHCVIEDGVRLDGCILGKNTQVGSKAELTRCVTQAGYEVGAGEILKGEKLEVSNWMATPDGSDETETD